MDWLWNTDGFPPRWSCGAGWGEDPYIGWMHIAADLVTWAAYSAIPAVLVYFVLKRKDVRFPPVFWLFCAFIISCGLVHCAEAVTFWVPLYRLSAVLKVVTALVSAATVVALIRTVPSALALPGLAVINAELRESKASLEKANQELKDFTNIASHDLRSPLRGVSQLCSWIEEDERERLSDEGVKHLGQIQQRLTRVDTLLDDLLAYAHVGHDDTAHVGVDAGELVDEIIAMIDIPEGFRVERDPDMPRLKAPIAPLRLVFVNLISNGLKHHGGATGLVRVLGEEADGRCTFRVTDDGQGIEPRYQGQIFGLFQKLQSRDEVEGSGLGLALVKKTVETLGGTIRVDSTPGEGATFTFEVPVHRGAPSS